MRGIQDRFSRQIIAFGQEGQRRIASVKVGIVGLGGIGSFIAQMLACLGVKEFVLIDSDIVEDSNLNRLIGASWEDAKNRTPKVDVAKRVINSVNPEAKITTLFKNLRSEEAINYLCERPEIIFSCVDNDSARLILTELSAAYEKNLIDCATEIFVDNAKITEFGGRVVIATPGDFCLLCANQIDLEIAKQELESKQEQGYRQKHGYGLGVGTPAPAVVSLNGIISGLAVTEFIVLVTNVRKPNRKVTYRGMRENTLGVFKESRDKKRQDCIVCNWLVGKRESADIRRFLRQGLPNDLPR